ncbi:hypothetical protein Vc3S01_2651 [Vibrio campbellii]|nr:hypothetical protein Vc3S01_2651 [Vibrio campbellii]EDL67994.1 hypothetical protein A1Q_4412 [Vibrio campbellii HY01]
MENQASKNVRFNSLDYILTTYLISEKCKLTRIEFFNGK